MTLNGHFALCFKIHAFSEPTTKIYCRQTLNREEQLRHRAVSLRQHRFLMFLYLAGHTTNYQRSDVCHLSFKLNRPLAVIVDVGLRFGCVSTCFQIAANESFGKYHLRSCLPAIHTTMNPIFIVSIIFTIRSATW